MQQVRSVAEKLVAVYENNLYYYVLQFTKEFKETQGKAAIC